MDNNWLTSRGRNGDGTLMATQLKNWLAKQKIRDKFLLNLSLVIFKILGWDFTAVAQILSQHSYKSAWLQRTSSQVYN